MTIAEITRMRLAHAAHRRPATGLLSDDAQRAERVEAMIARHAPMVAALRSAGSGGVAPPPSPTLQAAITAALRAVPGGLTIARVGAIVGVGRSTIEASLRFLRSVGVARSERVGGSVPALWFAVQVPTEVTHESAKQCGAGGDSSPAPAGVG